MDKEVKQVAGRPPKKIKIIRNGDVVEIEKKELQAHLDVGWVIVE